MKRIRQEIETVPVDTLLPFPGNPNQGAVKELERSMERLGFYGVILAQKSTRRILVGNHRWEVLLKEDPEAMIEVVWLDVDDATAIAILLGDNRINRLGSDNQSLLAEALQRLESPLLLEGAGYDQDTVNRIVASVAPRRNDPIGGRDDDAEDDHATPEPVQPRNPGNPVISYSIIFDDEEQQQRWYSLLRWLKRTYEGDTVSARLAILIDTILPEEGA